jgi:CRP-like cAMP-binding protein
MTESCIVKHFAHFQSLKGSDVELLETLEQDPVSFRKNTVVWNERDEESHFYTVKSGWACSYHNLEDGSRQVLDVFVPGDIIGLRECAFRHRLVSLVALTDAELCPFPQERLGLVFAQSSQLANLFFVISAADQAILLQRMINLGRRNALKKLAHFLVEMCERLKRTCVEVDDGFHLPLPQTVLGDTLGLSAVHVNRTCKTLREMGLIGRGHHAIDVLDLNGLKELADFDPAYLEQDLSLPLFGRTEAHR